MAQAHINFERSESSELILKSKRKVSICLDGSHYITTYQTGTAQTVVTLRRGTRSITIPKDVILQICDLKESLQNSFDFVENTTLKAEVSDKTSLSV